MPVAVIEEGESRVALSEVEDEGLGFAHANDHLSVVTVVGVDLFFSNQSSGRCNV